MSDEVYRAMAEAPSGFVEAPAGCGKTEAIVRTVGIFCPGTQLVLTHTHAGVDALRQRFRLHQVLTAKYHVDTIAGWCWGWVRRYPENAAYTGSLDFAAWGDVYAAMARLLQKDFVRQGVLNSYAGVIVDEYQDCTVPMHQLIVQLKCILPCRVLGDELQGIFGFGEEALVGWPDVRAAFRDDLGVLETPHRWIKAGNETLGRWLLGTRPQFRQSREPDYRGGLIDRRTISYRDIGPELVRLTHEKNGRICIIGPKARPLPASIKTALVNRNYRVLEPNELSVLRDLIVPLSDRSTSEQARAAFSFLTRAYGGLSKDDKTFLQKILKGQAQRPLRADRRALCGRHAHGVTPELLFDLLHYIDRLSPVVCKLHESVSALKCILEAHLRSGADLSSLYADEIAQRKYQSRSRVYRCTGSTLLVKGLEFDHVIVLRSPNWQKNWGNHRDLYVALTRGSTSTTLFDLTGKPV